jgi:DNA-binding HxlR family transcriptional regulator
LWRLRDTPQRYTELQRSISGLTPKMLTQQLRELEAAGLVVRQVYAEVPPRVEYSLTPRGQQAVPLIHLLRSLGESWLRDQGIDVK